MSMDFNTFYGRVGHIANTFKWYANASVEANQIRVSLGSDTTVKDTTLQTAPTGLRPGHRTNTKFMHAMLREVNKGKAGNLSTVTMANAIGGIWQSPPINTVAPTITYASGGAGAGTQPGAVYASGAGTWNPTGTRTNQWLRNGTNIAGSTGTTYTTQAADAGTSISIRITMTNSAGSTSAVSNSAAIT